MMNILKVFVLITIYSLLSSVDNITKDPADIVRPWNISVVINFFV